MTTKDRQKENRAALWRRRRDALIVQLGNVCAMPGCDTWEELEFDHPNGRDYQPRELNRWQRLKRYGEDFLAGNLRLLCRSHNASDGARRRWRRG